MNMSAYTESWWLASLGKTLIWARLRVHLSGTAEVFDCDGKTLFYDSEDSARSALLDADFLAWDGLDEDDAWHLGFTLAAISPPAVSTDELLRDRMVQSLHGQH